MRLRTVLWLGMALLLALVLVSLGSGTVATSFREVFSHDGQLASRIVWEIRFPRIALAVLVGASLAAGGTAAQALLQNSLADSFTLGMSGGAALGAAITALLGAPIAFGSAPAAFAGALAAAFFVFLAARRTGRIDTARLLLTGLVANAFFSALILLALSMSKGEALRGTVFWMMGSLASADNRTVFGLLPFSAAGVAILGLSARRLDLFLAGEESAASLGVDVERTKRLVYLALALLTAAAVASAGIIGFVGLLVPHGARRLVGSTHRRALPTAMLLGAITLVAADLAARTCLAPAEIPVGALAALVGAPFFLAMLLRARPGP